MPKRQKTQQLDNGADELTNQVVHCTHPVLQHKLSALRAGTTTPKVFRDLMREITFYLGYEATQDLKVQPVTVTTPLASCKGYELAEKIALIPVLRSGLGMIDAMLQLVPQAQVHHIGIYHEKDALMPIEYYNKLPSKPSCDRVIILEPSIASGSTIIATVNIIKSWGVKNIVLVSIVCSRQGLEQLFAVHPDVVVHLGAIDEKLSEDGQLVPGLGDVGDRLFGTTQMRMMQPI